MTIVDYNRCFVFIHVPKTGGTTVKEYFRTAADAAGLYIVFANASSELIDKTGMVIRKHSPARDVRAAVGASSFNSFFKFSIVRNPFLRAISTFRFLKHNFRNWKRSPIMDRFETFSQFANSPLFRSAGPGSIFKPQYRWLTGRDGELCMDFIARTETLQADVERIVARLSIPMSSSNFRRRNIGGGALQQLVPELAPGAAVDVIRKRYARDFELFGYSPDPDKALIAAGAQELVR